MNQTTFVDPSATTPVKTGVGNGTMSAPIVSSATLTENITVTCTVPGGSGVAQFSVSGSVSGALGAATSNVEFIDASKKIRFTITAGGTPWAVSDQFTFSTVAGTPASQAKFNEFGTEVAAWGIDPKTNRVERFTDCHAMISSGADNLGYAINLSGSGTFAGITGFLSGIVELITGASSNSLSYIWPGANASNYFFELGAQEARFSCYCNTGQSGTTQKVVGIGWADIQIGGMVASANQAGVFFRVEAGAGAANIQCVTKFAGAPAGETVTDSGIADSSAFHLFEIIATSAVVKFYIDGVLIATHTTDIPAVGIAVRVGINNKEAVDKRMRVDWIKESIPARPT